MLESEGIPAAAVTGTVGVERHRLRFEGQTAHAGTTPMDMRRDAGLAAAATALAVEDVARRHDGRGHDRGRCAWSRAWSPRCPGVAELSVDLRHPTAEAAGRDAARRPGRSAARRR